MFDYYDDPNVKAKHKKAYLQVKEVLAQFEATDARFNSQQLQNAWKKYCIKQALNMTSFAKWWAYEALNKMYGEWNLAYSNALLTGNTEVEFYATRVRQEILDFQVMGQLHFGIDTTIFT